METRSEQLHPCRALAALLTILGLGACGDAAGGENGAADVPAALGAPVELASPAAPGSAEPFVHAGPDGAVVMSWIEPAGGGHALRFASFEDGAWSAPRTIAEGDDWFVNWADFPSIHRLADGTLAANWLQRSGESTYAYGVRVALSRDDGATWSAPITPHRDDSPTEHGFVSFFPAADGAVGAVWLDGRDAAGAPATGGHGADFDMTIRSTTIAPDGTLGEELVIDDRTCECCQTDAAVAAGGPVVVYRNRSPEEIRDIYVATFRDGRWTEPRPIHEDGWLIPGCPVNGPAVAAEGEHVAVAWYTMANDTPRVRIAFSDDGGATFGPPARIDDGDPEGRVDLLLVDGVAVVSWLERGDAPTVRYRRVAPDGRMSPSTVVAATSAARSSGFPRMARAGDRIFLTWTVPGEPSHVHVAAADLSGGEAH